jgi:hypothetical protein
MTTIVVPLDGSPFAERALRPACSIRRAPRVRPGAARALRTRGHRRRTTPPRRSRRAVLRGRRRRDPARRPRRSGRRDPRDRRHRARCGVVHGHPRARRHRSRRVGQRRQTGRLWIHAAARARGPALSHRAPASRTRPAAGEFGRVRLLQQHRSRRGRLVRSTPARAVAHRSGRTRRGPGARPPPGAEPRGRGCEEAPRHAGGRIRTGECCEHRGAPRGARSLDPIARRASPRRTDRHRDPRPQRTDPHHHGQRRQRGRPPRPVSGADHTADGRPRVHRR